MDTKSSITELPENKNAPTIELKDDGDNNEQVIDVLIESGPTEHIHGSDRTIITRLSGIFYILMAALLITTSMFITKELRVDLVTSMIPSYLLSSIILIVYMKLIKHYSLYKQSKKVEKIFLLVYVFFSTTGYFALFIALRYLLVPDLTTIRYTQVIWTAIIAAIIFREKPSLWMILAILLTIIGVIFVAQPNFLFKKTSIMVKTNIANDHYKHIIGFLIALYASIAISIMTITNKLLVAKFKTKHSLIILYYLFFSLCMGIVYVLFKYQFFTDKMESFKNDFINWRYLCASIVCLLQIIAIPLALKGIKREHPSIFAIIQSSSILFSIVLQNIFSSTKSNYLSIFGSILVLAAILLITGSKFIQDKPKKKITEQIDSNK